MKYEKNRRRGARFLTGVLGLLLMLVLTGCGKMTPEKALARASAKSISKDAGEFRSDMLLKMDLQMAAQTMNMEMSATSEQTADPQDIHLNVSMDMGRYGKRDTEMYILSEEDRYIAYLNDGNKWTKQYLDAEQRKSKLDELSGFISEGFTNYVSGLENLTMTEEEAEGKKVYRIDSRISAESISGALKETLETMGVDPGSVDIGKLGSVSYRVWIEKKTFLPMRLEMDMTELMNAVLEESVKGSAAQGQVKVTQMLLNVKYYDYGQVGSIQPSEEAASARMQ